MKTILSSKRHPHLKRLGMLLIVVAFIAAIISCADGGDETEPTLDHFRCYNFYGTMAEVRESVELTDQFGTFTATVGNGTTLCNPVEKTHDGVVTPISHPDYHLMLHILEDVGPSGEWVVEVNNQFGNQNWRVSGPVGLAVPTRKDTHGEPMGLDYFLMYEVLQGASVDVKVDLIDQFGGGDNDFWVKEPWYFGNPVQITQDGTVTSIVNPDDHLVLYKMQDEDAVPEVHAVEVSNLFGQWSLDVYQGYEAALAVPSEKINWYVEEPVGTQLDHFRVYGMDPATMPSAWPYVGETVELEDQFGSITATVGLCTAFSNPVKKSRDGVPGSVRNLDHHSMSFGLEGIEPRWWRVTVSNQFGTQELTVAGPIGLSVPTHKLRPGVHDPPEGLDYFLAYEVINPPSVEIVVDLSDQFGDEPGLLVTQAKGFANPVKITHDGEVTEIVNEDAHFVSYWILAEGAPTKQHEVDVSNRFGEYQFMVWQGEEGVLSVPSEKIRWEPIGPPLDHFRCYNFYGEMPNPGEVVELNDQFGTFTAMVGLGTTLCNPVEKAVNEIAAWEWVPISHPDYHLMLHILEDVGPSGEWVVEVNNQFGNQKWRVSGPVGLAVPTRKDTHGEPMGLDYFLMYEVLQGASVDVKVDLIDQFGGGDNDFWVKEPWYFGNPVQITQDGTVTSIVNPDDHLVLYKMQDEDAVPEVHAVEVSNLFGQWSLDVYQGYEAALAVPSEKINWYAE